MATINENPRIGDVVLEEAALGSYRYTRETVTLVSGTPASIIGQVLGKISIGGATAAAKTGGNTGNGTLVMDGTTPVLVNAQVGVYTVTCTAAGTNSATFRVVDPTGRVLGDVSFNGSGASATFSDEIKFTVTDGATDFIVGDGFTVTIAAGSGKYTQVNPAAVDGSAVAAAILLEAANATSGDVSATALVRGPAILKDAGLAWTSGMTGTQQTTAKNQLIAAGMQIRSALGY